MSDLYALIGNPVKHGVRAGAAAVLSYYARNIAEWLQQNSQ